MCVCVCATFLLTPLLFQRFGWCRCIAISSKSTNIPEAVEFVTLEIEVDPAAFNARRSAPIDVADDCACVCVCWGFSAAVHLVVLISTLPSSAGVFRRRALPEVMTFTPSSPASLSVQMRGAALTAGDVVGAVTFDDLVAPVFLQCPPHESDRTFRVGAAGTRAEATLPAMAVYDAVDRTPTVEYPFDRRNFSAIGEASKGHAGGVLNTCVRVCVCVYMCVCFTVFAFLRCCSSFVHAALFALQIRHTP